MVSKTKSSSPRVLIVCSKYPPEYAGSGLRAHRTYQRLQSHASIECEVICSSLTHTSWRNETYEIDGVRVTRISSPWKRHYLKTKARNGALLKYFFYFLWGADEIIRTFLLLLKVGFQVDVFHTFGHCWSAGVAAIWAGVVGKPVFRELVTMQSRPDDPPGLRPLVHWALQRRGLVIAISPLLAERAHQLGFSQVWCRPNPVDEQRFYVDRSKKDELRRQYTPFASSDVVLVDLSKYSEGKNKELLLRMMPLLPSRYKLLVAGPMEESDRHLYQRLKELAVEFQIQDRVHIEHGFVEYPDDERHAG